MKALKKKYTIRAPLSKVWHTLTDQKNICEWGAGPAQMEAIVGTEFSLWGGDIHGKNIQVLPEKTLEQEWFSGSWKEPSHVIFSLTSISPNTTEVMLIHSHIPDEEFDDIKEGWDSYYMGPLSHVAERT